MCLRNNCGKKQVIGLVNIFYFQLLKGGGGGEGGAGFTDSGAAHESSWGCVREEMQDLSATL